MRLTKAEFAKRVRVGFELETHESDGETYYAINDALDHQLEVIERDAANAEWPKYLDAPKAVADWIKENGISIDYRTIHAIAGKQSSKVAVDVLGKQFDFGGLIDIGEDGSVDGFEFRTIGPNTVPVALKAIEKLFKLEHRVDNGCSFHVHASLDGKKHVYGRNMQARLYAAVIKRLDQLPDSVIERLNSESILRWAKPYLSTEKYSFVAFRGHTWEFRAFGNVSTEAEAKACLQVALDSLLEATNSSKLAATGFKPESVTSAITAEYNRRFKKKSKAA